MKSGLSFLVAARRCEIEELEQLARTSDLVGVIGRLVHALQRERGLSNVFIASRGQRFADERTRQIGLSREIERSVRDCFDALAVDARRASSGARLFSRIARVLPGLDALPALRRRVEAFELTPAEATAALVKLIAGLLAVVFEAADGATDPEISRLLVAMFNFMQGKEFAGQERAVGAAAFALGHIDDASRQQWLHLIESQERCFQVFTGFSSAALLAHWARSQPDATAAELERLRRMGALPAGQKLDPHLSQPWFDCCTRRIDAMRTVEEAIASELRARCDTQTAQAHAELDEHQRILDTLVAQAGDPVTVADDIFFNGAASERPPTTPDASYGRHLERAVLEMMQAQSQRLQAMSEELDTVRASLNERKLIERAKGLLMAHRRMTEEEAHKMLRQTAMNQNRRLSDVAESVLAMADYLPVEARRP